jgi:hypothetical protein
MPRFRLPCNPTAGTRALLSGATRGGRSCLNEHMRVRTLILFCLAVGLAAAASIDGAWTSEMKMRGGKKGGGQERTVTVTMNLKSDGNVLSGTVSGGGKKRGSAQIQDGKIEGNQFSFTTVRTTKKGEQKQIWRGTIDGDTLRGTRSRPGGKRGQPFTAKRG